MYSLYYTLKGWYRHRDTAIRQAVDQAKPEIPQKPQQDIPETTPEDPQPQPKPDNLSYIAFEEFQKTLENS